MASKEIDIHELDKQIDHISTVLERSEEIFKPDGGWEKLQKSVNDNKRDICNLGKSINRLWWLMGGMIFALLAMIIETIR